MHRLSLTLLLAATAALAACQQDQPDRADVNVAEPAPRAPIVPRPQPPVDRASLLAIVAEAASAAAAGAQMPESVRSLDGRQFEFRIRFGCRGPAADLAERWLGWSFAPQDRRIRVRAMPTISSDEPLVERISDETVEAVEGFWIPRPWLLVPVCPAAAAVRRAASGEQAQSAESDTQEEPQAAEADDEPAVDSVGEPLPAAPRIGIAQFFTREDPRSRRRGLRPYQSAHTLEEGQALSSQGYNLVLSGRLRALPESGVIHCVSRGADTPPECIVSAEFLRVWIEQPDTREVIAEWGAG